MNQAATEYKLFAPLIEPNPSGGIDIIQGGKYINIPDSECERFVERFEKARRGQLIQECQRVCWPLRFGQVPKGVA